MRITFACLVFFVLTSCNSGSVPKGVLPPEQMEKIIKDLVQVDEYLIGNAITDTGIDVKMKRSIYYQQIFDLYKTNRKEFYSSYKYYQQHPDLHKTIFDTLSQRFTREKMDTSNKISLK